jgi:hypothetical protein
MTRHRRMGFGLMTGNEPPIPEGIWPKVRWTLTYATSWMVPLVAIERFADGHYLVGWILAGLFLVNLFVVSKWDQIAAFLGRRRVTMYYIALALVCAGGLGFAVAKLMGGPAPGTSAANVITQPSLDTGRIAWNIEEAARGLSYFLGFNRQNQEEVRITGFAAHGRNTSNDPITELKGFIRSDVTNEELPLYVVAEDPNAAHDPFAHTIPTLVAETYGIPGSAEFNITTFNKAVFEGGIDGIPISKFMRDFSSFTLVLEYDGNIYKRQFTQQEIQGQLQLFERQTDPSKNTAPRIVRRPNATPPAQPSFHFPPPAPEPAHDDKPKG